MKSLSKHILTAIIVGSALLVTVLDIFIWDQTKSYLIEEIKRDTHEKVNLARKILDDRAFENNETLKLKKFSDEIKSITGLRATLIDRNGNVLADSDIKIDNLKSVKNHLSRPEIQEALRKNSGFAIRKSLTINRDLMYYCENIRDGGRVIGFIRFALFSEDFADQMNYTVFILVVSNLVFFLIVIVLGYFYWKYISNQFLSFEGSLQQIKDMKKFSSIPPQKYSEFDKLASLSNSIGENFQTSFKLVNDHKRNLTSIFDSLAEGVASFDSSGKLNFFNDSFCKVLGISIEIEKENHYYDLVQFPPLIKDLSKFEESHEPIQRRSKYYKHKYIEYNILPLKTMDDNYSGFILTVEDVSQLQELETVRTDFVANVSHEFKTPLTSIKGYAETLQMGALNNPELAQKFLKKIEHQAMHLENLVMDLLNLTRIEREDQLEMKEINAKDIVLEIIEDFKPQIELQGQTYKINSEIDDKEITVLANQFLFLNICSNLLTNAIHYNKKGGTVTIELKSSNNKFRIGISDEGIGVSGQEIKRIFERFYRVEEAKNIYVGGSGLGLAIVKHAVDLLGGELGVNSEEGNGSTFWVELPIK